MSNRLKKYGMMIIAAVLLVALAFAGAASADSVADPVAKIKETGVNYATVEAAFTAATNGQTIELLADSILSNEISVSKTVTLDLNGKKLTAASGKRLFKVNGSSKIFTLTDSSAAKTGKLTGGSADNGGGVKIEKGMFVMNGGTITGCSAYMGGGVYVTSNTLGGGTFTMSGGSITNCSASNTEEQGYGGGVYVGENGTFTMSGGSITDCNAAIYGGGVYVGENGTFTMSGGSISGCTASYGGAYVYKGTGTATITCGIFTESSCDVLKGKFNPDSIAPTKKIVLHDDSNTLNLYATPDSGYITLCANPFTAPMGKVFAGWSTSSGGSVVYADKATNVPENTADLYAVWVEPVAKIVETGNNYATVDAAFEAATDGQTIELLKDSTLGGEITVEKTVTLDLNGKVLTAASNQRLFGVSGSSKTFTLKDSGSGGKLTGNGMVTDNGGGVNVGGNYNTFKMTGGSITGCSSSYSGGGVNVDSDCTFEMTGGSITGCSSSLSGGGVFVCYGGLFKVSGSATVTGNTNSGSPNNVYLCDSTRLQLTGTLTGKIGIVGVDNVAPAVGNQFGTATSSLEGAGNFFADTNKGLVGEIVNDGGYKLKWKKSATVEVTTWAELKAVVEDWTETTQRTITVLNSITSPNAKGTNDAGIVVKGNVKIIPAAGKQLTIDANESGRFFKTDTANAHLTLAGNTNSATLTLKNGCGVFDETTGFIMGGAIYVNKGGKFTLSDGATITNCSSIGIWPVIGGAVYVEEGEFVMDGGTISNCIAKNTNYDEPGPSYGGAAAIKGGKFTMTGGAIENCKVETGVDSNGGAVYLQNTTDFNSSFEMSDDAVIEGCSANKFGGGVYVGPGCTFTMSDGSISGCSATGGYGGGGVMVAYGTFTMDGGSITDCSAENGGGLEVGSSGLFVMSDGSITDCSANYGGGVYVFYGVIGQSPSFGRLEVCGNATVTGNTLSDKTTANNVYLGSGTDNLKLVGPTSFTGTIGIANPITIGQFGTIASSSVTYSSGFVADKVGYTAYADGLALKWKYTEYSITYNLDGGTNATTNPAKYTIVTPTITLADATKTGHTFDDWYSNAAMTVANRTIPAGSSGNKAFWAKFTPNKTTVTFDYIDLDDVQEVFTYDDVITAEIPTVSERDGYAVNWKDSENIFITDPMYTDSTGKWVYTGADGGSLRFYADYETPTEVVEKAGASGTADIDKTTALAEGAEETVQHVILETVSDLLPDTQVIFIGASTELTEVGQLSGYTKVSDISIFEVNIDEGSISGETATMRVKVTFADADAANKYKNNVRFVHYDTTKNQWETSPLASSIDSTDGNVVIYKVETKSFSPFGISIQTKNSSGSHQGGSRILPATDAPTVMPTQQPTTDATPLTPTVKPTQQQTQKSPAPLAGLVLGLGAAAVLLRLRR